LRIIRKIGVSVAVSALACTPDRASAGRGDEGSQMILAWIDQDGLVAGFSVDAIGLPQ